MPIVISPHEVLEIAIQIEANGAKFYEEAAPKVSDKAAGKLLESLARMEAEHGTTFNEMLAELAQRDGKVRWVDQEEEGWAYLRLFAAGQIFDTARMSPPALANKNSVEKILEFAIARENESVLFFTGMARLVVSQEHAERIGDIIAEEMDHAILLSAALESRRQKRKSTE